MGAAAGGAGHRSGDGPRLQVMDLRHRRRRSRASRSRHPPRRQLFQPHPPTRQRLRAALEPVALSARDQPGGGVRHRGGQADLFHCLYDRRAGGGHVRLRALHAAASSAFARRHRADPRRRTGKSVRPNPIRGGAGLSPHAAGVEHAVRLALARRFPKPLSLGVQHRGRDAAGGHRPAHDSHQPGGEAETRGRRDAGCRRGRERVGRAAGRVDRDVGERRRRIGRPPHPRPPHPLATIARASSTVSSTSSPSGSGTSSSAIARSRPNGPTAVRRIDRQCPPVPSAAPRSRARLRM